MLKAKTLATEDPAKIREPRRLILHHLSVADEQQLKLVFQDLREVNTCGNVLEKK